MSFILRRDLKRARPEGEARDGGGPGGDSNPGPRVYSPGILPIGLSGLNHGEARYATFNF